MVNMNEVSEDFTPRTERHLQRLVWWMRPNDDDDADGIWQITIDLEEGSYGSTNLLLTPGPYRNLLHPGDPCAVTAGIFTNRQLDVLKISY